MMAGQIIEEPVGFNFQTNSVHSGSISFGRFADEPLLWERRSSFSHSRIEEEVARCSKHRIVTEKKAYFEAQFKKKALRRQCSLDVQTGINFETHEKDNLDMRSCEEYTEYVKGNEDICDTSAYTGYREDYDNVEETQISVDFVESSYGSNDFEEQGMEYNIEGREIIISEPLKVAAKVGAGTGTTIDAQTVIDCPYSRCISAEHDVDLEQNFDAHPSYVVDELKDIGLCTETQKFEKEPSCESIHSGAFPKVMVAIEPSELNVKVTCTQRDSLCESSKMNTRIRTKVGQESAAGTRTFKQTNIVSSTRKKLDRSPNPEHLLTKSTSFISKTPNGLKSVYKETRVTRVTKYSVPAMIRGEPNAHQSPKRTEKVKAIKSSGLDTFPSSLRIISNVRAEEKKEMLSTAKQSGLTHKSEINQSHSRFKGKTPDEIKKFSRDLNATAKLVRPAYNKVERLEPKSKEVIIKRPQMNPSHARTKVVARTSMHLKAENGSPNAPSRFQASIGHPRVTSHLGKQPTTSVVSSLGDKSNYPSSTRNAAITKGTSGINKIANLKSKTVAPTVDATKGQGTVRTSKMISERTNRCTTKNVREKARPLDLCRTAAKVC